MKKRSLVLSVLEKVGNLIDGNICRFATCVFLGILIRKNKNKKSRHKIRPGQVLFSLNQAYPSKVARQQSLFPFHLMMAKVKR